MVPIGYSYPAPKLDIYIRKYTGKCLVSFHEPENLFHEARTFIVDINKPFDFYLPDEKVSVLKDFPSFGEVFAVDFGEDGLHRAVCNAENKSLFFIDCGEIIEASNSQLTMYSLSEKAQNASARAILCEIEQMMDEKGNEINDITEIFSIPVLFSVVDIHDDKLVVVLRKFQLDDAIEPKKEEHVDELKVHEIDKPTYGDADVTDEQRAQLYEEPEMITTNAMKAVYGYDPQDDKLICPFFDEKTGRCYKGNACRLLHVSKMMDGWTRDRKEAMIKLVNDEIPIVGSTVKVCITCIVNVEELYIHIPEMSARYDTSLEELKKELNGLETVKCYKPFVGQPHDLQHDLVFVKRKGLFYRGKVVDYDEEQFSYIIFFLDYGYTESIPQKDIFQWYPRWNIIPALANRCCLENVKRIKQKDAAANEALRNLILNTSEISAKIIAYTGNLYIQLFDENGVNIGDTLAALRLVELTSKIIPSSTQVPG